MLVFTVYRSAEQCHWSPKILSTTVHVIGLQLASILCYSHQAFGLHSFSLQMFMFRLQMFMFGLHSFSLQMSMFSLLEPLCSSCCDLEGHSLLNFPARGGHPWSWAAVQNDHRLIIDTSAKELRLLTDMPGSWVFMCTYFMSFPDSLKSNTFCCISLLDVSLFPFSVCVCACAFCMSTWVFTLGRHNLKDIAWFALTWLE